MLKILFFSKNMWHHTFFLLWLWFLFWRLWNCSSCFCLQQPQICRWYHSNGRKRRGTKEMRVKEASEKSGLKLKTQHSKNWDHGIQSHHFMANRWGKVEAVTDFLFLGSKITADGDCSHEIKKRLLLGRKAMTNIDSILKETSLCWQSSV